MTEVPPPDKKKIEIDDDPNVPGLFKPQPWDIDDEFKNNEAYRDYQKFNE